MESERLARIEEKLDGALEWMKEFRDAQGEKNAEFFAVRDRVQVLEIAGKTAWKIMATLGTVSAALGAGCAWVVEHPPSFLWQSPPSSIGSLEKSTTLEREKSAPSSSQHHSSPMAR
jgi:hypothetical protein